MAAKKAKPERAPTPNIPELKATELRMDLVRSITHHIVTEWLGNCAAILQQEDKEKLELDILTSYGEAIRFELKLIAQQGSNPEVRH